MNAVVTGCAGFIGSHLTDALLAGGHRVVGYDNLSTGSLKNLATAQKSTRFRFIKTDLLTGVGVPGNTDVVFHLAALGSVPRSMQYPIPTHRNNTEPLMQIIQEAKSLERRPRIVFASSSSVYGDSAITLRHEDCIGSPTSPYAASKQTQEIYAETFARAYDMEIVGLRYFNVFGPRQGAQTEYSAVIPKWAMAMLKRGPVEVFGDPGRSRDFTPVYDVVRATMLAGTHKMPQGFTAINIGTGRVVSLEQLFEQLATLTGYEHGPIIRPERLGDVWSSCADIRRAYHQMGYTPSIALETALAQTVQWLREQKDQQATEEGLH